MGGHRRFFEILELRSRRRRGFVPPSRGQAQKQCQRFSFDGLELGSSPSPPTRLRAPCQGAGKITVYYLLSVICWGEAPSSAMLFRALKWAPLFFFTAPDALASDIAVWAQRNEFKYPILSRS